MVRRSRAEAEEAEARAEAAKAEEAAQRAALALNEEKIRTEIKVWLERGRGSRGKRVRLLGSHTPWREEVAEWPGG